MKQTPTSTSAEVLVCAANAMPCMNGIGGHHEAETPLGLFGPDGAPVNVQEMFDALAVREGEDYHAYQRKHEAPTVYSDPIPDGLAVREGDR